MCRSLRQPHMFEPCGQAIQNHKQKPHHSGTFKQKQRLNWKIHVIRREDNGMMKVLTLHATINKRFQCDERMAYFSPLQVLDIIILPGLEFLF